MPKIMSIESIKKKVKQFVSEIAEIPEEKLKDDARFYEDLNVDSMMALEIVAKIEKEYRVPIPEKEIPKIRSLQDVYKLLEQLLNK
jgi:acyl carrier protein